MSERQQFALLRQMEFEDGSDRGQPSLPAGSILHGDWALSSGHAYLHTDGDGATPDPYKSLGTHEQLTDTRRLESGTSPSGPPHRSSIRERPPMSTYAHTAAKFAPTVRSKLFQLTKLNDLDSLKQVVKDGVNINEQDERGRTALHEFSAQNLPRSVAYLLRHGAQPNLASLDGDTALHEAARAGFVRVIRTLLRHGADPLVHNNHGERPLDVCHDAEALALLNQHADIHRSHSAMTSVKSINSSKSQRHHHGHLTTGDQSSRPPSCTVMYPGVHESYAYVKSCSTTTTPDCFSDSDDTCSGSGIASASAGTSASAPAPHCSNDHTATPSVTTSSTHMTVSPGQKGSFGEPHLLISCKPAKKDPYAFEDETDESPEPGASLHSASSTVNPGKSASPNARSRSFGSASVSSCGLGLSTATTSTSVSLNTNPPTFVLCSSQPSCDLNVLTAAVGQNGPPLRLRFAKEAGQYTLMENQQGTITSEGDYINDNGAQLPTSFERKAMEVEHTTTLLSPEDASTQGTSSVVVDVADSSEIDGSSATQTALDQEIPSMDFNSDDGCSSQKVPPLRIKFAPGASCDPESIGTAATAASDDSKLSSHLLPTDDVNPNSEDVLSSGEKKPVITTSCLDVAPPASATISMSYAKIDEDEFNASMATSRDGGVLSSDLCDSVGDPVSAPGQQPQSQLSEYFAESQINSTTEGTAKLNKDLRHRGGRTLRSHTAAQREREEKERHANVTPIKKRKLRSRNEGNADAAVSSTQSIQQHRNSYSVSTTSSATGTSTSPMVTCGNGERSDIPETTGPVTVLLIKPDPGFHEVDSTLKVESVSPSVGTRVDNNVSSPCMRASPEADDRIYMIDTKSKLATGSSSPAPPPVVQAKLEVTPDESQKPEALSILTCPASLDDDKRFPQLLEFENPYEKAAALQKKLRELVNSLVEVHPKAPSAYEQYLLVSRNYLLAYETPSLTKKLPPPDLNPVLASLFTEQEEERYAQALKHQSEREHLRLCAEQARLRAQTRAALANLSKPLSFCSVLGYTDLTYVPAVPKAEQRDEECARDRFTQRTFIGWLEDIRDSFQGEKKKLLCRQLHEAESLMMVQRLDWEIKLKGCHMRDYSSDVFRNIPPNHVPLIHVPSDFPLFPNDPVLPSALV